VTAFTETTLIVPSVDGGGTDVTVSDALPVTEGVWVEAAVMFVEPAARGERAPEAAFTVATPPLLEVKLPQLWLVVPSLIVTVQLATSPAVPAWTGFVAMLTLTEATVAAGGGADATVKLAEADAVRLPIGAAAPGFVTVCKRRVYGPFASVDTFMEKGLMDQFTSETEACPPHVPGKDCEEPFDTRLNVPEREVPSTCHEYVVGAFGCVVSAGVLSGQYPPFQLSITAYDARPVTLMAVVAGLGERVLMDNVGEETTLFVPDCWLAATVKLAESQTWI